MGNPGLKLSQGKNVSTCMLRTFAKGEFKQVLDKMGGVGA